MFLKLFKHELKATGKVQGILAASALAVSVLGALLLYTMYSKAEGVVVLQVMGVLMLPVLILTLVAYSVASNILLYYRFYKNKFTDEGYLTFTLPVTTNQIIWSAYLNILLWSVLSTVIGVGAIFLLVGAALTGAAGETVGMVEIWKAFWQAITQWTAMMPEMHSFAVLTLVGSVISGLAGMMSILMAITLGCTAAKKHKILASFGIAYGINLALGTLQSTVTMSLTMTVQNAGSTLPLWAGPLFQILLYLALGIGSYLTVYHFIGKKLNLS